ncbi:von Willebrand factor type A domain protein [Desulfosarcina variabilis str. Montpellier]
MDETVIAEQHTSDPRSYSVPFEPARFEPGLHSLKVVARAQSGQQAQDSIEIDIQPAVELTLVSPRAEARVGETAAIEADLIIRSDHPPASVRFTVDGQEIGTVAATPYAVSWETRSFFAGEHEIMAHSILADGTAVQDTLRVMVVKEMSIAFANPDNWQELGGNVPLALTIYNEDPEDPVAQVCYTLNDQALGHAGQYPFDYQMDASGLAPGNYTIRAEAETRSGKVAHATVRGTVSTGYLVVGRRGEDSETADTSAKARFFFAPRNVEIILDASNSMWGQLAEGSKIDIVKQVLANIVPMIPSKTQVALRVYGSGSPVKRGDCKDSQLLMSLSPLNREKLLKQIRSILPKGKTPIAYSINQAPKDLADAYGACVVLLITDGIESCDGDPVAAAAMLKKNGIKVRLHVIGYDVGSDADRATLTSIARAGGGAFFTASSGAELADAIVEAATIDFRVVDSRKKTVLKSVVGSQQHQLKIGTYTVIIDLDPPQELLSIQVSRDRTTKITMIQNGDEIRYELID